MQTINTKLVSFMLKAKSQIIEVGNTQLYLSIVRTNTDFFLRGPERM